jgi:hypothetical protein
MSGSLELQVGLTLDTWNARHRQHEATLALRERAVRENRGELNRRQRRFQTEIGSVMDDTVGRANPSVSLEVLP